MLHCFRRWVYVPRPLFSLPPLATPPRFLSTVLSPQSASAMGETRAGEAKGKAKPKASKDEAYLEAIIEKRIRMFEAIQAQQLTEREKIGGEPIKIKLPDGTTKEGKKWMTSPIDIAKEISSGLAASALIAQVNGTLWDMTRPLEGDCELKLFKFDSNEGRDTFWHSSAHILGQSVEMEFGCKLCIGPCTTRGEGFYYDAFYDDLTLNEEYFDQIKSGASKAVAEKQPFERIEVSREQALEMFSENKFKVEIINELPEDKSITVYRCGPLVDLCRGPHIPNTSFVKAFSCLKASSSYWRGKSDRESLQRVYGISFPDSKRLKEYLTQIEEAKKRDHRLLGQNQELFFFHPLSPGSCFFLPHGTRIYNKLIEFMHVQYRDRGYQEVLTPNMYNMQLWEISGHAANYKENMFVFEIEKQEFGLKPMNCPGHCLMFEHRVRSYRELPLRLADFGVLHRNELSGALTGLTRVRRFQQDDAHIFCRESQIKDEVKSVLEFISYTYGVFGFTFELELSTRPEKYLGDIETWEKAEAALADALNEFGMPWQINEGDGAFYGPKIDIGVFDALKRKFQCATLQLDFQLPLRFKLSYSAEDEKKMERPVMIHRAILGSVERMFAILLEHYKGKWPFWLSPRQAIVCNVNEKYEDYAKQVRDQIHRAGYYVDADVTDRKIQKKTLQQQQQQQQPLRKSEGDPYRPGGLHGVIVGNNFPSSSGAIPVSQTLRNFNDVHHPHAVHRPHEVNQNKGQCIEQQLQNPIYQAYLQLAFQTSQHQKSHGNPLVQKQGKINMVGPAGRDQDMHLKNLRIQDLVSRQVANQAQPSVHEKLAEHIGPSEKLIEKQCTSSEQRNELKPPQTVIGQIIPTNMLRPMQSLQAQANTQNIANNQMTMAQLQAMQAWAMERNIDLSHPSNANFIAQVWQSARLAAIQKPNEISSAAHQSHLPSSKQQFLSSPGGSENSAHGSSLSDHPVQDGPVKNRQTFPSGSVSVAGSSLTLVNSSNIQMQQQVAVQNKDNQNERVARPPLANGNGGIIMDPVQSSGSTSQTIEHSNMKREFAGIQSLPVQSYGQLKQLNQPMSQPAVPSTEVIDTQFPSQGGLTQVLQQNIRFTKQQLHVLKAQILAFRRIKRGDRKLPQEVLDAITPPPLASQLQQPFLSPEIANHERAVAKNVREHVSHAETVEKGPVLASSSKGHDLSKERFSGEEKATMVRHSEQVMDSAKEPAQIASVRNVGHCSPVSVKSEQDAGLESQKISIKSDCNAEKGKAVPEHHATIDAGQVKKTSSMSNAALSKDVVATRKYHGPLFDFLFFTRKNESFGSTVANSSNNLILAYDVKDLLCEEGTEILNKKRTENLRKISGLLTVNLERKRIMPDLVLRLQIEEKKLRLLDLQARLRDEVDQQQQEIMAMPDRPYRKFVKQCERQRTELMRQVQQLQKTTREKQLKSIFQWRKKLLEAHWAIRDARTTRNRGVAKYHERMLREFSKKKDDDRNKRMEALKNNDVDRYREMLLEQQTSIPGGAAQRYAVLSSFLSETERYLHKLGGKITAAKNHQEVVEAANVAAAAARSQGLSEEEVKATAACAGEEVMIRNRFSEMNAPKDSSSANRYYSLAHAVSERVVRQPSMLRCGTLRDYQLVGLQWMLSLYNNKLNGILADEMGLGKTVQVMSLIAYLMEFKGNYGPHLIIVPNAVLVNWKSELHNWLPTVSCIFYVGGKDQRSRLFSHEVCAMKFNVLVTTYEFVMYDRSRLSKVDWKYIIIDEAQRMKDRESVLARDLDRYRCQRRLLLTGTPLQNDLKELWSLLNLLLPEVFDNRKAFHDWFSKPFQKDGPSHSSEEDDWLETEKKVIIIHRLHQILEPFMLRRRVEDVEGSLPRKDSIVLRCRMSAIQGAIYDWIKSTGTLRLDPEDEFCRAKKNPMYQVKTYKNLNNKCMELRKACNHPLLNYPYYSDYSKDFIIRSCGKLWILDRILIKLHRAGHRVLLFSTMTKLLDILEDYLQWRQLVYRRIDGSTSLEDREAGIVDFNSPESDCFIFLLSIRAAGRGLNLQSADTVVIYDPDPNPQNEEQAVARAYRIGQKREVKVIYMEAVVDKISSYQKEDDLRNAATGDLEDDLAGKDRYMGSIESLIRNNIQQYKIDMADEVINAGRFDQRTTHEERRMTLETLLHDEERYQETVHDVPSMQEVNRMIARSEEEIELFDQMDDDFDWTGDMMKHNQVPKWLRAGSREVNAVIANLTKKPSKNILTENIELESGEIYSGTSPGKTERRRGRPRGPTANKKHSVYMEVDDEDSDASSEEMNIYSFHEEEGEIGGEFEEEESDSVADVRPTNRNQLEEQVLACDGSGCDMSQRMEGHQNVHRFEEAASSGSSSESQRLTQPATPSVSSQKFGSLSAIDARPGCPSKRMQEDLEEGEIAVSGDSQMDLQQSGSWINEHEDGEDEQVLQPTVKRKRSIRVRPRYTVESLEEKSSNERIFPQHGSQLPLKVGYDYSMQSKTESELETFNESVSDRQDANTTSKQRHNLPSRKASHINLPKFNKSRYMSGSTDVANEYSRDIWNGNVSNTGDPSFLGTKMSDSTQRKCKNVISKLQRKIDKDGYQVVPLLSDLWKKNQNANLMSTATVTSHIMDLRRIDQLVDNLEYNGVLDFIAGVQLMLQNVVKFCNYSYEVRYEVRKLHDLFFDIVKIAFPDTDFREARNAFTVPSPAEAGNVLSSKLAASSSQNKRPKTVAEVKPEPSPIKPASCGPVSLDEEHGRNPGCTSKSHKESGPASGSGGEHLATGHSLLTHPGDLVICRKKRKDREKSAVKKTAPISLPGPGPISPLSATDAGQAGPKSSPSITRSLRIPVHARPAQQTSSPGQRADHPAQQAVGAPDGPPVMDEVQWARPVKRMRTDTGKRRPSHL